MLQEVREIGDQKIEGYILFLGPIRILLYALIEHLLDPVSSGYLKARSQKLANIEYSVSNYD